MTEKTKKVEYLQFTQELVEQGLREVGLKAGDKVFVHSSVKDLAPARQLLSLPESGMQYVVKGLQNVAFPSDFVHRPI